MWEKVVGGGMNGGYLFLDRIQYVQKPKRKTQQVTLVS